MAMRCYSTFPKSSKLEHPYQMQNNFMAKELVGDVFRLASGAVGIFYGSS